MPVLPIDNTRPLPPFDARFDAPFDARMPGTAA